MADQNVNNTATDSAVQRTSTTNEDVEKHITKHTTTLNLSESNAVTLSSIEYVNSSDQSFGASLNNFSVSPHSNGNLVDNSSQREPYTVIESSSDTSIDKLSDVPFVVVSNGIDFNTNESNVPVHLTTNQHNIELDTGLYLHETAMNNDEILAGGSLQENNLSLVSTHNRPHDNSVISVPETSKFEINSQYNNSSTIAEPVVSKVIDSSDTAPPLGSRENPIRLIQQGNKYTPVQHLNSDQLTQIMRVIQNQQTSKQSSQTEGTSVMFNSNTNTKVIYRVVYPDDTPSSPPKTDVTRKRRLSGTDTESRKKVERVKLIPRTRSGRISKPPKHMLDDYKHIDFDRWDMECDDDDGGYADISYDQESTPVAEPEILTLSPTMWTCQSCGKEYVRQANLARHHALFPDHNTTNSIKEGDISEEPMVGQYEHGLKPEQECVIDDFKSTRSDITAIIDPDINVNEVSTKTSNTSPPNRNDSDHSGLLINETLVGFEHMDTNGDSVSLDGSSQNSASIQAETDKKETFDNLGSEEKLEVVQVKRPRGRPRGSKSRVHGYSSQGYSILNPKLYIDRPLKRKNLLKKVLGMCNVNEIVDITIPYIMDSLSVWEYLLKRLDHTTTPKKYFYEIYHELKEIHSNTVSLCKKYVEKASIPDLSDVNVNKFLADDSLLMQSLGLERTMYKVKDIRNINALDAARSDLDQAKERGGRKKTVQKDTPQQRILTAIAPRSSEALTTATPIQQAQVVTINSPNQPSCSQILRTVLTEKEKNSSITKPKPLVTDTLDETTADTNPLLSNFANAKSSNNPQLQTLGMTLPNCDIARSDVSSVGDSTAVLTQCSVDYIPNTSSSIQLTNGDSTTYPCDGAVIVIPTDENEVSIDKIALDPSNVVQSNEVDSNVPENSQIESETTSNGTHLVIDDSVTDQRIVDILGGSTIYQSEDGHLLIQRPDGVALQLQGDKAISLETLQTLLSFEAPFT